MKQLVTVIGILSTIEVLFTAAGHLALNAGIVFILAAPIAGVWAYPELARKSTASAGDRLRAERKLIFACECLIIGTANVLAGPHVLPLVAKIGAAGLASGQTLILLLAFRKPRILRPVEPAATPREMSVRATITAFFYVSLCVVGAAIFVSRFGNLPVQVIPIELQWPGLALLYATLGCLALGFASEHERGTIQLYAAAVIVAASSITAEYAWRQNWYFLAISLLSFVILIRGWSPDHEHRAEAALAG